MQDKKFYQQFDPVSGQMEWKVVEDVPTEDDEDMIIQIARSNFGDMIYDYDRNERFSAGLKCHIDRLKSEGQKPHVVDIGTGTGLLSMMAARHGASQVTAVEVFEPMAITAEKVVKKNGLSDVIKVVHSRSTDVDERHVSKKGDIIVAEVFDTELIGEGALRSFKEGLPTFGKPGCRVVPAKGRIWVIPVASKEIQKFRKFPNGRMKAPFEDCPGTGAVFDVQLSEFPNEWFQVLSEPFIAFDFNFEDADSINYNEEFLKEFEAVADGYFDTILFWWDLDMNGTWENVISTVPTQFSDKSIWRDHWMQAIYFLPKGLEVKEGDEVPLICAHDEYSLWFDLPQEGKKTQASICSCQLHCTLSRYDFYRLNTVDENEEFVKFIGEICRKKKIVTFSDGSLISLYASRSATQVYAIETGFSSARMIQGYSKLNSITNISVADSVDKFREELKDSESLVVLAEPFFSTSILPWHAVIRYAHLIEGVRNIVGKETKLEIYPNEAKLMCMPVVFKHLWKIAAPVGTVDGFDLSDFDDICQKAREIADPIVEQHSLFEYVSVAVGDAVEVYNFDFGSQLKEKSTNVKSKLEGANAFVFWMDYSWREDGRELRTSNGLREPCGVGKPPKWHPGHRQGVYFIPRDKFEVVKEIKVKVVPGEMDIGFEFENIVKD